MKPSIPADTSNLPNGDLKAGDRFMITAWCKSRAYVRTVNAGGLMVQDTVPEPTEDDRSASRPNTAMFGDVIEVLGIDYPWAICDVHSVTRTQGDYGRTRTCLDLREFECKPAAAEYIAAVMSGMKLETPPPPPPPSPAEPASALAQIVLGAMIAVLICAAVVGLVFAARLVIGGAH